MNDHQQRRLGSGERYLYPGVRKLTGRAPPGVHSRRGHARWYLRRGDSSVAEAISRRRSGATTGRPRGESNRQLVDQLPAGGCITYPNGPCCKLGTDGDGAPPCLSVGTAANVELKSRPGSSPGLCLRGCLLGDVPTQQSTNLLPRPPGRYRIAPTCGASRGLGIAFLRLRWTTPQDRGTFCVV
jgi:hypothetical protein